MPSLLLIDLISPGPLGTVKEQLDHFGAARSGESAVKPRACDPPSKLELSKLFLDSSLGALRVLFPQSGGKYETTDRNAGKNDPANPVNLASATDDVESSADPAPRSGR